VEIYKLVEKHQVNNMIVRLFISAGLVALGYYVGKQIGRDEHIRHSLDQSNDKEHDVTNKTIHP